MIDQSPELWREETTYSFSGHPSGRLTTTGLHSLRKRNPRELGVRGTHLHILLHKETEVSIKEYILSERGAVLGFSVGIVGRSLVDRQGVRSAGTASPVA